MQTSPLAEELLFALMTRPIIIHQPEETPLITSLPSLETQAPQQDRASIESELLTPQVPLTSTSDHHPVNETPIHPVEPVLGMTPSENYQLQDRNRPQDIMDILGTAAYEGYIQTPIQTLDGLYVNQPKHFLPLAKETK